MLAGVSHRSILSDSRLTVKYTGTPVRERSLYIVEGVANENRTLKINNPDIRTLETALLERVFFCKVNGKFEPAPIPRREVLFGRLRKFKTQLLRTTRKTPRISPEQFAETYTGRKRTIYEQAVTDFYAFGVQQKDSRLTAFVKCEKVPANKAPRCIQARTPVFNVALGTFLKPAERKIYKGLSRVFGYKVVTKGLNVREVGELIASKWSRFRDPVYVGLDATKFDMHVHEFMLEWTHSFYSAYFNMEKATLRKLLKARVNNKGFARCDDGTLKYNVRGKRCSGDIDTASGNCLIMCALVWSYCEAKGIEHDGINNGDDHGVMLERSDLEWFNNGLKKWFLEMGFRMTVEEPVYEIQQIEFCQMHPLRVGGQWTMVRNFNTAREKDSMSIIPLDSEQAMRKWLYAVGECGMALCSGVPVMQSLYQVYMRSGKPSRMNQSPALLTGASFLARGLEKKWQKVTDEARLDFYLAFDITPDEQVALETLYGNMSIPFETRVVDSLIELSSAPF